MENNYHIVNAKIEGTQLGYCDHDILTFGIHVKGDGWGVCFGNIALDEWNPELQDRIPTKEGFVFISKLLKVLDKRDWENIKGTHCRIVFDGPGLGAKTIGIGNILKDKWLYLSDIYHYDQ